MGDKTPTKGSQEDSAARKMESPMTPRKAEKRSFVYDASPRSRRALEYDHMATLFNKKPRVFQEELNEVEIASLEVGPHQQKRLVVKILAHITYEKCVKVLACDNTGFLVITAFEREMESLLHVARLQNAVVHLSGFDVRDQNTRFPTANHRGIEGYLNFRSSLRSVDGAPTFDPPYNFVGIKEIRTMPTTKLIDVLAIVAKSWDDTDSNGNPAMVLSLFDKSENTLCFTVGGHELTKLRVYPNVIGKVVAIRSALTSGFGGRRSIQALWFTLVEVEPAIESCYELNGWYDELVKKAKDQQTLKEELKPDVTEEEELKQDVTEETST